MKQFPIATISKNGILRTTPHSDAFECRGHISHGHYTCVNFNFTWNWVLQLFKAIAIHENVLVEVCTTRNEVTQSHMQPK